MSEPPVVPSSRRSARRAGIIVLDGLGIGRTWDQEQYGDTGSDTLGNVLKSARDVSLPNLSRLGLGNCRPLHGVPPSASPTAAHGIAHPASAGKDSTTGHWELCGVVLETPCPTFPQGFPQELITEFSKRTGRGVLGNKAASGTAVLDEFGEAHTRSGDWIV